ncbi:uncharacterized protein with von Willebrand factor type A (vWA) domain [Kibdelosporangium banguiense]|uniref:Uncharacterized protein with von Willebrand factor type A (VWA) domain n=1 Tax=Kibdelosporangium banguiense TaxID=1365924 RepID=A0ABS4TL02_9PSEU|nr:VWA domain-containing protein [Kibdelosporangium banguiense]MBP2325099.1 uncharacterized protein with von Willebrand factor type A (vWA) domain [Kibdelosporangium banguiense]
MLSNLVHFGQSLRSAGLTVGTGDLLTFTAALDRLAPTDLQDLYWAGRTTLVTRREDIPVYNQVFRDFFLNPTNPATELMKLKTAAEGVETTFDIPETEPGQEREEALLGLMASTVEVLRSKELSACTDQELAKLRRIQLIPPNRRTRRTEPTHTGHLDIRQTIRATMRTTGDPVRLLHKQRRTRPRPVVLILDVSGSMADYSRALLQFAHAAKRSADKVEIFCFGTRLARITHQLRHRNPDTALQQAAHQVTDWDGGTRIGHCMTNLLRTWGRVCRGSVVMICSDGLDRGSPETLTQAIERLSRLSHRIIWINPHHITEARPLGLMIATPHIDTLLTAPTLDELATAIRSVST